MTRYSPNPYVGGSAVIVSMTGVFRILSGGNS